MGIILSALAGAGNSGVDSINQNIAQQNALDLNSQRSDLELQKAKAIADYQNQLANAPANRAGALVQAAAGAQVPVTAAPITTLTGTDPTRTEPDGTPWHGLPGNIAKLTAQINTIKDPDQRQAALDTLAKQVAGEQAVADSAVSGQTRTVTPSEALAAAYSSALANGDLQSAAALKSMIPDKTVMVGKDSAIVSASDPSHVLFANTAGADREQLKINADRAMQDTKGRQESILKAMQLDPLGINAPPGGYMKALAGGDPTAAGTAPQVNDDGSAPAGASLAERIQGKTGADVLKELPPPVAIQVKAILAGTTTFPSTARNNPRNAQLLDLAAQVDPDFDATNFNVRNKTAMAFASGPQGDKVKAVNQAIAHAGSLYDEIGALNNSSIPAWNAVANAAAEQTGDTRPGQFRIKALAVASELRKVFAGSTGGSMHELTEWQNSLPANASKEQQLAYLRTGMDLLHGGIDSLQNQYDQGMGKINTHPLVSPKAQATLDRIEGLGTSAPSPTPSGAPAAGVTLTYDPATGTFH